MPDVLSELVTILTESFDVLAEDIEPDRTLDDLGVDSVATIELVDILQEKFGIKIAEDELTNKNTVEQVSSTLAAKAGAVTP